MNKQCACILVLILFSMLIISCGNIAYGTVSGTVSGGPAGSAVRVIATTQAVNLYNSETVTNLDSGVLDSSGSFSYSLADVITGRKYVIALVDTDGDGDFTEPGSYIGAAEVDFPTEKIPGSGNVDIIEGDGNSFAITCGVYAGTGFNSVQIQFEASSVCVGEPAYIGIDTDTTTIPFNPPYSYELFSLGTTAISHTFTGVADGSYYCFAHFDVNGNDIVDAGDWFGYHDSYTWDSPPTTPTLHLGIIDLDSQSDTAEEVD